MDQFEAQTKTEPVPSEARLGTAGDQAPEDLDQALDDLQQQSDAAAKQVEQNLKELDERMRRGLQASSWR